ncbi:6-phosphofructokinase [Angelakisella massiliensis]|uniref:6-phosphofructokinase n=1 Tax=Angelakisella massiliensis TaxID=1871018 RepID=UPI0024B1E559|nr:6-phosphofructokinase [Angelakisella massiliensis]
MQYEKKTIGVLTSGGDAPGMNAAVRAVVRAGNVKGHRVVGIRRGYQGLINGDIEEMKLRSVCDIIQRGGTVLYTARCPEFVKEEGQIKGVEMCHKMGIDGLVVIGGDGSYRGARALSNRGIPCIGIPGTIDNDIASTEYTIGFDTAVNTVVESVDRLRDTSQSHDRCSVVEVMGRRAGHIALHAGIACGAIAVLIPEREFNVDVDVIDRMKETLKTGKHHFIVIVAEGVGDSKRICEYIEEKTGIESRLTVLGHVQRGGTPTAKERVYASVMGYRAVELLEQGKGNRVVGVQNNRVVDFDINDALEMTKDIDQYLYKVAYEISI